MNAQSSQSRVALLIILFVLLFSVPAKAQHRRTGVVVDERLAALRAAPFLSAKLLKRLSRGRLITIRGERRSRGGVVFYRVSVTRRTGGWIQREAVVAPSRAGDDERLFRLIEAATSFDRIVRARIFLNTFPRSAYRPNVLLLFGDAAQEAAAKLSRDAAQRLDLQEIAAGGGPEFSYFLNYNGLDRYNRQGVKFAFDQKEKRFHYDGASWREIIQLYPLSPPAAEARQRLLQLTAAL